jgi:hypothetical protein
MESNLKQNGSLDLIFNFRIFIILLIMFISVFKSISQNKSIKHYGFGVSIGTQISGNSLGGIYEISGNLYNNNNMTALGLCLQGRTKLPNGLRIGYSRILTGFDNFLFVEKEDDDEKFSDKKFQLCFFSTLQYTHNAHLSDGASLLENKSSLSKDNDKPNYSKAKLSTIEVSIGFGLNTKIGKNIIWSNYIGLSSYYHTNYINGMYIDKSALALTLGTTIGVKFYRN